MIPINLCFSSDNAYAPHLGVVITSIVKNKKEGDVLNIYVLDGGISRKNKRKLACLKNSDVNIELLPIDRGLFENLPLTTSYISAATYYRFLLPTILHQIDKVLYLDCDMIVEDSLRALFDTDIDGFWIAGVEDIGYFEHRKVLLRETESFYVNAGLLLINLKKWREDNIQEKLFAFSRYHADALFHQDQDVINFVLNKKSKPLDLRWNIQSLYMGICNMPNHPQKDHPLRDQMAEALRRPGIYHFVSQDKPWNSQHGQYDRKDRYFYYKEKSLWRDTAVVSLLKSLKLVR